MSPISLDRVITLFKEYTQKRKKPLEITLLGGLAVQHYGMLERATNDLYAEVKGDVEGLSQFLKDHRIPADVGENISGWSVISMPPGYRKRAVTIHEEGSLKINVLHPLDFIIAKLRRFTEEDIQDALFVAGRHRITADEVHAAAGKAIRHSVKDTALFLFRGNVHLFVKKMSGDTLPFLSF